jgi:hypothetical protein
MDIDPLNIHHSASLWRDLHSEAAVPEARKMVASMQSKGDHESADLWLRIIVALEALTSAERARS